MGAGASVSKSMTGDTGGGGREGGRSGLLSGELKRGVEPYTIYLYILYIYKYIFVLIINVLWSACISRSIYRKKY